MDIFQVPIKIETKEEKYFCLMHLLHIQNQRFLLNKFRPVNLFYSRLFT